jgi:tetratricopeptide (TPR) repeat protein
MSTAKNEAGSTRAAKPNLTRAKFNFKQGIKSHIAQQYYKAIEHYDAAIKIHPNYAMAYSNKGISLDELGRKDDAIKCYDRAIQINPKFVDAYVNKGTVLNEQGKNVESIKCYDKAILIDPKYTGAYYNKGNALKCLGRFDEVIDNQNIVIELDPSHDLAHFAKAVALHCSGRPLESILWFDKTIRLDPNNAQPYSEKGVVLKTLGRYTDAITYHDMAKGIDSEYSLSYYYKGDALKALDKYLDAIDEFNTAIGLEDKEVLFYVNKGNTLNLVEEGWGRVAEAKECFLEAERLLRNDDIVGMEAFKDLDEDRQALTKEIVKVCLVEIEIGDVESDMDLKVLRDDLVCSFLNVINDKTKLSKIEIDGMMADLKNLWNMIQKSLTKGGKTIEEAMITRSEPKPVLVIGEGSKGGPSFLEKIATQKEEEKNLKLRLQEERFEQERLEMEQALLESSLGHELVHGVAPDQPILHPAPEVNTKTFDGEIKIEECRNIVPATKTTCKVDPGPEPGPVESQKGLTDCKEEQEGQHNYSEDDYDQNIEDYTKRRPVPVNLPEQKPDTDRVISTFNTIIKMRTANQEDLLGNNKKAPIDVSQEDLDLTDGALDDDRRFISDLQSKMKKKKSNKKLNAKIFRQDSGILDFVDDVIN